MCEYLGRYGMWPPIPVFVCSALYRSEAEGQVRRVGLERRWMRCEAVDGDGLTCESIAVPVRVVTWGLWVHA